MSEPRKLKRRECRIMVMQMLYEYDIVKNSTNDILRHYIQEEPISPMAAEFIKDLFLGVCEHIETIDELLYQYLINWDIDRLIPLDRAILRMGAYELKFSNANAPKEIVINEAVEISKIYSAIHSSKLINGVLDKIAKNAEPS